jgi:hypothetical protein
MKLFHVILCALAVLTMSARVEAAALYASSAAGGPGELYIINPANGGMVTDVGALNDAFGVNYGITGLAFNPFTGLLYGSTGNSVAATAAKLVSINPATGLVTVIGSFNAGNVGNPSTMSDLAFDPSTGTLYGVGSIGGPQLYRINPLTGQATVIGNTGLTSTTGGGLAISSAGLFHGTPTASRFGTYNPLTGAYTDIANPNKPVGGAYAALDYDENGVLYGLNLGSGSPPPSHLVTINPATGLVTDLGLSLPSLDGIAFAIVPEPSTAALGMGALAMAWAFKSRRRVG